jgi:hypothetical protein
LTKAKDEVSKLKEEKDSALEKFGKPTLFIIVGGAVTKVAEKAIKIYKDRKNKQLTMKIQPNTTTVTEKSAKIEDANNSEAENADTDVSDNEIEEKNENDNTISVNQE